MVLECSGVCQPPSTFWSVTLQPLGTEQATIWQMKGDILSFHMRYRGLISIHRLHRKINFGPLSFFPLVCSYEVSKPKWSEGQTLRSSEINNRLRLTITASLPMNPPIRGKLGHSVERVSAISVLAHSHMDEGTSTHNVHSQEGRNVGKCSQSAKIYVHKFVVYLILLSNTRTGPEIITCYGLREIG